MKSFRRNSIWLPFYIHLIIVPNLTGQTLEISLGESKITGRLSLGYLADNSSMAAGHNAGSLEDTDESRYNTFLGTYAGIKNTVGKFNTVTGHYGFDRSQEGSYNTVFGYSALSGNPSEKNTSLGGWSFGTAGIENVALGLSAGDYSDGSFNTFLGIRNGYPYCCNPLRNQNIIIGNYTNYSGNAGSRNVMVGDSSGLVNHGSNNVFLGHQAAQNCEGGGNVIIGNQAARYQVTLDSVLWVENSSGGVPLLYGDFASDKVGINCSDPQASLSVVGDIKATGVIVGSALPCSSDFRYKKNITDLENVLMSVNDLRAVRYQWRKEDFPERHFNEGDQIGFIAQEVEEIFPELTHTAEDGYKSMDYARLTVVLTKALQELIEKNQHLKQACNQLEEKLALAEKKAKN